MADRTFVDTNVLIYDIDATDPRKQMRARAILDPAGAGDLVISSQVLSEFYVVATRKLGVDGAIAQALVHRLMRLPVVVIDAPLVVAAISGSREWGISYWDALIVRAAEAADCRRVLSEDLANGARYGSITIENPFA
jgi:predicted nucleic acid-binding protein